MTFNHIVNGSLISPMIGATESVSILNHYLNKRGADLFYLKTAAGGMSFFLAMILNPTAQLRAQEEIDRVVGPSRLPGFEDRSHLPYVTALMKEVIRFHAPAASGLSRSLSFLLYFEHVYLSQGFLISSERTTYTRGIIFLLDH